MHVIVGAGREEAARAAREPGDQIVAAVDGEVRQRGPIGPCAAVRRAVGNGVARALLEQARLLRADLIRLADGLSQQKAVIAGDGDLRAAGGQQTAHAMLQLIEQRVEGMQRHRADALARRVNRLRCYHNPIHVRCQAVERRRQPLIQVEDARIFAPRFAQPGREVRQPLILARQIVAAAGRANNPIAFVLHAKLLPAGQECGHAQIRDRRYRAEPRLHLLGAQSQPLGQRATQLVA